MKTWSSVKVKTAIHFGRNISQKWDPISNQSKTGKTNSLPSLQIRRNKITNKSEPLNHFPRKTFSVRSVHPPSFFKRRNFEKLPPTVFRRSTNSIKREAFNIYDLHYPTNSVLFKCPNLLLSSFRPFFPE